MLYMDVVPLATRVRHAGCLDDFPGLIQWRISSKGVGLQNTGKVLQMLLRMFALAVGRVGKPDRRRSRVSRGSVVAHVHPQSAGLGRALAGREHRYRNVIAMQLVGGKCIAA